MSLTIRQKKHYHISVAEKNTDEKLLKEYFTKTEKIKMIFYRKRENNYNNYDFYYLKEDGTYILYSINLEKEPPELINAYPVERNFDKFKKAIIKRYAKQLVYNERHK